MSLSSALCLFPDKRLGLANLDPSLSAKAGPSQAQCAFAMTAIAVSTFAFGLAPAFALAGVSLSMTCFFLASIWLRLFAESFANFVSQDECRLVLAIKGRGRVAARCGLSPRSQRSR
jgi:hypothetical protein